MKKSNKFISMILVLIMAISLIPTSVITASAIEFSGACGENLTWNFDDSTGKMIISGTGAMDDYYDGSVMLSRPWDSQINAIKNVVIDNGVTSVGSFAFYGCTNIETVTITDSVTTINLGAFANCSNLTSVTMGNGVTTIEGMAFGGCGSLAEITIPEGVTTIGDMAFASCGKLTSVVIPDGVNAIGNMAFVSCTNLTSVVIPDSVTVIGMHTFADCKKLTDVYYTGTQEQWNDISFGSYNNELFNATIHYNYCPEHSYGEWTTVTEATCTTEGEEKQVCSNCGDTKYQPIPVTEHSYTNGNCTVCGEEDPDYFEFSIKQPSITKIRNKDTIVLHANIVGNAPEGSYVEWTSSNDNFYESADENKLEIIAENNGYTTFTATLYDADGNTLATDSIEMYSKSAFLDKIGGFFRQIFGSTIYYNY